MALTLADKKIKVNDVYTLVSLLKKFLKTGLDENIDSIRIEFMGLKFELWSGFSGNVELLQILSPIFGVSIRKPKLDDIDEEDDELISISGENDTFFAIFKDGVIQIDSGNVTIEFNLNQLKILSQL